MDFYVVCQSHNSYGGHSTLSQIGHFLLQGAIHFGEAVQEITVTLYLTDTGSAAPNLEEFFLRHQRDCASLPKVNYQRSQSKLKLDIASALSVEEYSSYPSKPSLSFFQQGLTEVIAALKLSQKSFKQSDDFNFSAFIQHCEAATMRLPHSEDALQTLMVELETIAQTQRATQSPWEKLDVDWSQYHPTARQILDDPLYWQTDNYFAPHGNDTGFDLLSSYAAWFKRNKAKTAMQFLHQLATEWGYSDLDQLDPEVYHQAIIALTFAQLKLKACFDAEIGHKAFASIADQEAAAQANTDWAHRDECLSSLLQIAAKLKQFEHGKLG